MSDHNTYEVFFYIGGLTEWAVFFGLLPVQPHERVPDDLAKRVADRMQAKLDGFPPIKAQSGLRVRVHVESIADRPNTMSKEDMQANGRNAAHRVLQQLGLPPDLAEDTGRYEGHHVCTVQR